MNTQSVHSDALFLLLEAVGNFCEVNEIARKKDKDNHIFLRGGQTPLSFLDDGSVSYTTTIEDVARDLFLNPTLLPQKITMCLEDFLNSQQGEKADRDSLIDYFSSDEASLLFEQKRTHFATQNNQVVHEVLVGHIGRGWILSFIGSYGDYQKRGWDVRAVFSVMTGLSRETFATRIAARVEKWARSEIVALSKSIQNTTRNLPQHLQHLVWENIIKQYSQNDILNPLNTWHERQALREVLKEKLALKETHQTQADLSKNCGGNKPDETRDLTPGVLGGPPRGKLAEQNLAEKNLGEQNNEQTDQGGRGRRKM